MSEIQQDATAGCSPGQQGGECQMTEETDQNLRGNLVEDLRQVQVCLLFLVPQPGVLVKLLLLTQWCIGGTRAAQNRPHGSPRSATV